MLKVKREITVIDPCVLKPRCGNCSAG